MEEKANKLKEGAPVIVVTPVRNQDEVPTLINEDTSKSANSNHAIASREVGKATTELSQTDIQRIQSYNQYSCADGKNTSANYISFENMYTNERDNCDFSKDFSPLRLSDYYKSKVDWLTSPRLVYCSAINQFCIRGILSLTYYSENKFKLTSNVMYQRDVEYRIVNSVTDGTLSLKLESIHYLSDFKAVK